MSLVVELVLFCKIYNKLIKKKCCLEIYSYIIQKVSTVSTTNRNEMHWQYMYGNDEDIPQAD